MTRLSEQEWTAIEAMTGKSQAIMRDLEGVCAEYGDECLTKWQVRNGLRDKPRFRVKATSKP